MILSVLSHCVAANSLGTVSSGSDGRKQSVVMRQAGYFYPSVGIAVLAHDIYDKPFSFFMRNFHMNVLNFDIRK